MTFGEGIQFDHEQGRVSDAFGLDNDDPVMEEFRRKSMKLLQGKKNPPVDKIVPMIADADMTDAQKLCLTMQFAHSGGAVSRYKGYGGDLDLAQEAFDQTDTLSGATEYIIDAYRDRGVDDPKEILATVAEAGNLGGQNDPMFSLMKMLAGHDGCDDDDDEEDDY